MISSADVQARLRQMRADVEGALVTVLRPLVAEATDWPAFERQEALEQLLLLSDGKDCNYDRPTLGAAYALWYQARRMQEAARMLLPELLESVGRDVEIVDLGAGTGATAWGCALVETALQRCGAPARRITLHEIDASPSMLTAAQSMWQRMPLDVLPGAASVQIQQHLSSWAQVPITAPGSIAVAGYLFDTSDAHRALELGVRFARTLEHLGAQTLLLVGTAPKKHIFDMAVKGLLTSKRWAVKPSHASGYLFRGSIQSVGGLRAQMVHDIGGRLTSLGSTAPSWDGDATHFSRITLDGAQQGTMLSTGQVSMLLDDEQRVAATPDQRLTMVVGAAGSGKSRVLVERLTTSLLKPTKDRPRRVMVTTFNKQMTDQLAAWFRESLSQVGLRYTTQSTGPGHRTFVGGTDWEVLFINLDKLPTRLFGVRTSPSPELIVFGKQLEKARRKPEQAKWLADHPFVTAEFLTEEFRRVVYGSGASTLESYLAVRRSGRPQLLREPARSMIWRIMDDGRAWTYTDSRMAAARSAMTAKAFDAIYVDECQDLTLADFRLLGRMITDPKSLVCFGDETQAGHTGASYGRPGSLRGRQWKDHELTGSYRLPIRVCEAVHPIAEALLDRRASSRPVRRQSASSVEVEEAIEDDELVERVDIVLPEAAKSAVLGVRPILVAGTPTEVEVALAEICRANTRLLHERPEAERIVWAAEHDQHASKYVDGAKRRGHLRGYTVDTESIQKIKGLERPLVVWSMRTPIPEGSTKAEWFYALVTRTTGLMVILMSDQAPEAERALVARLREDRLLFWNAEAQQKYKAWQSLKDGEHDPLAPVLTQR